MLHTKKRNDIYTLKAFAIVFVVLYHFFDVYSITTVSNNLIPGGFLGVDVFFVVSGFLIAQSIYQKLLDNKFSLKLFYISRIKRIYPPLIILCSISIVLGYFLLFPRVFMELCSEIVNTFIFTSNFRFANSGGYFSLSSVDKPLLHLWYVCVTIQFYLIYPLIVFVLFKIFKTTNLKIHHLVLFVIFLTLAIFTDNSEKSYLITQARIYEIFLGTLIFYIKDDLKKFFKLNDKNTYQNVFEAIGLFLILFGIFTTNLDGKYWQIKDSLFAIVGTTLILFTDANRSILNIKSLVYIGKISYSIYLVHWPVFVFAARLGLFSDNLVIVCLLTIILSLIFYYYCEKKNFNKYVLVLLLISVSSYSMYSKKVWGENYLSNYIHEYDASKDTNQKYPSIAKQYGDITLFEYEKGNKPTIFIIGDSHTEQYKHLLDHNNFGNVLFAYNPATLAYGKWIVNSKCHFQHISTKTRHDYSDLYLDTLSKLKDNDKVILANNWFMYSMEYYCKSKDKITLNEFKDYTKVLIDGLDESISLFPNLKFYIVGQSIYISQSIAMCTQADFTNSFLSKIIDQSKCKLSVDYEDAKTKLLNEAFYEYAQKHDNVTFIDKNSYIKSEHNNLYKTTFDDNKPIFRDPHHYTIYGGDYIGRKIFNFVKND